MSEIRSHIRPLDAVLRERLHLKGRTNMSLRLIRGVLQFVDGGSRLLAGRPFFALKESENILRELDGLQGKALIDELMRRNGGTQIIPHGLSHIPASGPVVIASTHPTGMFDFLAHAGAILQRRPDLKVVANQETEKFLGPDLIVPVRIDKQNRATSGFETSRAMRAHLAAGGALLIFGSGRVPHREMGRLVEPKWRGGASRLSETCDAPIIPAALNARNSRYYYKTRDLAQFLSGGDDNFGAMIGSLRYLAEFLEKLGGRFDVFYGRPMEAGSAPDRIKVQAEKLVPGLYRTA